MEHKYDIFISYRSEDGAQYARILQMQLERVGYRVFLDYDELKRDRFGDDITLAIQSAPIFLMVLTPLYLERCKEEGNWIKREISLAIEGKKNFVPLNPDRKFNGIPDGVSPEIADIVENYQHSIIDFGQALKVTFEQMVKNQIYPVVKPHRKKWGILGLVVVGIILLAIIAFFTFSFYYKSRLRELRTEIEIKHQDFGLCLNPNLSALQITAIDEILSSMKPVKKDSLWVSKFEFSTGWWKNLQNISCPTEEKNIPITNVTYGQVCMFILDLNNIIKLKDENTLMFALPSVEEWEYAAHSGCYQETTLYAGSNVPDSVAWFNENSHGKVHNSDGEQEKRPNRLDLFDMSGNVSEMCSTPFDQNGLYTICGGNYASPITEITIDSRKGFDINSKDKTVGFRIIIRKQ